jgi:hypothetical protein
MAVYSYIPTFTARQFLVATPPWPPQVESFYVEPSPAGGNGGTFYRVRTGTTYTPIANTDWVVEDSSHVITVVPNATFILTYAYVSP